MSDVIVTGNLCSPTRQPVQAVMHDMGNVLHTFCYKHGVTQAAAVVPPQTHHAVWLPHFSIQAQPVRCWHLRQVSHAIATWECNIVVANKLLPTSGDRSICTRRSATVPPPYTCQGSSSLLLLVIVTMPSDTASV